MANHVVYPGVEQIVALINPSHQIPDSDSTRSDTTDEPVPFADSHAVFHSDLRTYLRNASFGFADSPMTSQYGFRLAFVYASIGNKSVLQMKNSAALSHSFPGVLTEDSKSSPLLMATGGIAISVPSLSHR